MKIINTSCLHKFWQQYPETEEHPKTWICIVNYQNWNDEFDVIRTFPKAKFQNKNEITFHFLKDEFCLKVNLHYNGKILTIKAVKTLKAGFYIH